jgi:hypothetical protein
VTTARLCACGCKHSLAGRSRRTRFYDARCRQRAYRRRLNEAAEAIGVPARLSLKTLASTNRTGKRHGDGPTRPGARQKRKRDGAALYLKRGSELEAEAARLEHLAELNPSIDISLTREAYARAIERRRKRAT